MTMHILVFVASVIVACSGCSSIVVDLERFDRTCADENECVLVRQNLCTCVMSAINDSSLTNYTEATRGLAQHCIGDHVDCGDYRTVCVENVCEAESVSQ